MRKLEDPAARPTLLVVRLGALGDILRTLPAVRLVRRALPHCSIRWLVDDYGWDKFEAYFFLTQAGRVRLGNMVDPKYTLGASILKTYLT